VNAAESCGKFVSISGTTQCYRLENTAVSGGGKKERKDKELKEISMSVYDNGYL
jgi:hypothetical protein